MKKKIKLPRFKNEAQERAYWSKVDLSELFNASDFGRTLPPSVSMRIKVITSPEAMRLFATKVAETFNGGDVLALVGDLGAGKTTFVQGLAKALGVRVPVKSPTFVRLWPYKLKAQSTKFKTLVHVDAYRVKDVDELRESGLSEYLERDDVVTVVEWADRIKDLLPKRRTRWMRFEVGKSENERVVRF